MTEEEKDAIVNGLNEIERRIDNGVFEWREDREDVHMNIEAALTDLIGEPAKKLHTARSRNDQVVTDVRLWCRDAIDRTVEKIEQLQVNVHLLLPSLEHHSHTLVASPPLISIYPGFPCSVGPGQSWSSGPWLHPPPESSAPSPPACPSCLCGNGAFSNFILFPSAKPS